LLLSSDFTDFYLLILITGTAHQQLIFLLRNTVERQQVEIKNKIKSADNANKIFHGSMSFVKARLSNASRGI
jgi:hypothetical protein